MCGVPEGREASQRWHVPHMLRGVVPGRQPDRDSWVPQRREWLEGRAPGMCQSCREWAEVRTFGMCRRCYSSWWTAGRPNWEEWAQKRRQRLARTGAGAAACAACERMAEPRRRGQTTRGFVRLTAGMCGACYEAWRYAGMPDRGEWVPRRRQSLKEWAARNDVPSRSSAWPSGQKGWG
jgi:hypothetical protein